jgi:hypothetical protein
VTRGNRHYVKPSSNLSDVFSPGYFGSKGVHVVTLSDDGRYRWQDRDWNSLSEIARTITGTQWSGPAFFGTKPQKRAA